MTVDPGLLNQTRAFPSAATKQFAIEMGELWNAIVAGVPSLAQGAFFPRSAYLKVKAISNPSADYADRLVAHFDLDILAAHRYLGTQVAGAKLLYVSVPTANAAWINPGTCYNAIGYWHLPGARIVYKVGSQTDSIGIASMISWRGVWYVVHLGGISRTSNTGLVDSPSVGQGTQAPPGGC